MKSGFPGDNTKAWNEVHEEIVSLPLASKVKVLRAKKRGPNKEVTHALT